MIKAFNNLKEIKKYYDEETNTYDFSSKKGHSIDKVILNFDLNVESDIIAYDISAPSITAKNINAWDITVWDMNACDIKSLNINAGIIKARDIKALHIKSMNIYARDIKAIGVIAVNIYARDIIYTTTCRTYEDFKCNSIKCTESSPSHYTKYGKLEVAEDDQNV